MLSVVELGSCACGFRINLPCCTGMTSLAVSLVANWMWTTSHIASKKRSFDGSSRSPWPVSPNHHQRPNATRPKRTENPNPIPVHATIPPAMPRPPAANAPPPIIARPDVITLPTAPMLTPAPTTPPAAEAPITDHLTLDCSSPTHDHTAPVPRAPPSSARLKMPPLIAPPPNAYKPLVVAAAPPVPSNAQARTKLGAMATEPPKAVLMPADCKHCGQFQGRCWLASAIPESDGLAGPLGPATAWSKPLCSAMRSRK
mmetsp:Transcript_82383/g.233432  ORF Transcript_82383/g.233432 Transcript_82383/m.233432 type:complete len:257 (+) Transcript_82383:1354-2124(+)